MRTVERARCAARGFSMVELLVTVVLAGIIFAAMVPVFANALKETSRDNFRVTATNIAQDRIEKIRMLNFADITEDNLSNSSFADNEFGGTFTTIGGKTYTIAHNGGYLVRDEPRFKTIEVKVSWGARAMENTTVQTVIMNPSPEATGSTPSPSVSPSPHSTTGTNYTLMVSVTDDDVDTTYGVRVVRIDVTPNVTPPPTKQVPNAASALTCSWSPLVGGPDVVYRVTIKFRPPGYSVLTLSRDVTLVDSTSIYFDTNPYQ